MIGEESMLARSIRQRRGTHGAPVGPACAPIGSLGIGLDRFIWSAGDQRGRLATRFPYAFTASIGWSRPTGRLDPTARFSATSFEFEECDNPKSDRLLLLPSWHRDRLLGLASDKASRLTPVARGSSPSMSRSMKGAVARATDGVDTIRAIVARGEGPRCAPIRTTDDSPGMRISMT
jgi:hypothetical protein